MRFTMHVDCDNAAFEPDGYGEAARILRKQAEQLRIYSEDGIAMAPPSRGLLFDINGNTVGSWQVEAGE